MDFGAILVSKWKSKMAKSDPQKQDAPPPEPTKKLECFKKRFGIDFGVHFDSFLVNFSLFWINLATFLEQFSVIIVNACRHTCFDVWCDGQCFSRSSGVCFFAVVKLKGQKHLILHLFFPALRTPKTLIKADTEKLQERTKCQEVFHKGHAFVVILKRFPFHVLFDVCFEQM